jgi:hypothetical protein
MKVEKVFLPVFVVVVISVSVGIYLYLNSVMEKSLTKNNWCVESKRGSGVSDCKLILDFQENGVLNLTLADGNVVEGKWSYNGEVLTLSELSKANHFSGEYEVEFKNEGTPTLVMNSSSVALMALGIEAE